MRKNNIITRDEKIETAISISESQKNLTGVIK